MSTIHPKPPPGSGSSPPDTAPPSGPPQFSTTFLVKRAQKGEESAFDRLHARLHVWLGERMARRGLPPTCESEDLVQEVLGDVFSRIDDYQPIPEASFRSWVLGIADHKRADLWRRACTLKRDHKEQSLDGEDGRHLAEVLTDDRFAGPSTAARTREMQERFAQVTAGMSGQHRRVLNLREAEGLPFEEIARIIGYNNPGTARSLYKRARDRRCELLRQYFDSEVAARLSRRINELIDGEDRAHGTGPRQS